MTEAKQGVKEELEELRADLARAKAENDTVEEDSARRQIEELERNVNNRTDLRL